MGSDLVGRVVNVGNKCEDIKVGDRVCALGLAIGGNAKYAILPASRVFFCPEDIPPTTVVCLVRNFMAAYQCLHRAGGSKIRPGSKVLITGGAGALGQALIQLAVAAGADEIYATGKGSNSRRIIENLGAQALGRKPAEWLPRVKGEMDIVVDSVCADDFVSSHRALNRTGKLVCVGSTAIVKKTYNWNSGLDPKQRFYVVELASSMPKTSFYDVFSSLEMKREVFRKDLFRLFHLCRNHEITPKVAFCITLDEVANAQLDLEAGGIDGTIVCLPFGPEGKKINVTETGQDQTTEYEDGINVRRSLIGGALPSLFGKVMKDGTFKVLNKNRNDYDDDLYSVAGGIQRSVSRGGINRVDSTPFGFQDDMDRSYHRAMVDEEEDSESTISPYKKSTRKIQKNDDDDYGRADRRSTPRSHPGTRDEGSRRRGGYDDNARSKPKRDHSRIRDDDDRSVRSSRSTRSKSKSRPRRRDDDDDNDNDDRSVSSKRSTRSHRSRSKAHKSTFRHNADDDDDRSTHSRSKHRNSGRRNVSRGLEEEYDRHGNNRPSRSKGGRDVVGNDMGLKRTTSILRNKTASSITRTPLRGGPSRHTSSSRGGRHESNAKAAPSTSIRGRSRGRSASQPIPRAHSRSRDPDAKYRDTRGRARSRSLDSTRSLHRQNSPSDESVYSQGTQASERSGYSRASAYSTGSQYSKDNVSVATSVVSKQSEYSAPEMVKPKRPKKKAEPPEPAKSKKSGLFSRFRSKSRLRVKDLAPVVVARPKQRVSTRNLRGDKAGIQPEKSRHSRSSSQVQTKRHTRKGEETRDRPDVDRNRDRDKGRDRRKPKERRDYDTRDDNSFTESGSNDEYEEQAVRSVVSLNCASGDSLSSGEGRQIIPREPTIKAHRKNIKPRSALKPSRRSSSRPSSSALRPSSRASPPKRASSSRRNVYDDDDY